MAKGEINVNACYDAIVEILKNDEEYKEKTGNWISTEELHKLCRKRVKGLREIEFYSALELENDEFSPEVEKYLKRIRWI